MTVRRDVARFSHGRYVVFVSALLWLQPVLGEYPRHCCIVEIGCGMSVVALGLVKAGYSDVTALDISTAAIRELRARHKRVSGLKCTLHCMNLVVFGVISCAVADMVGSACQLSYLFPPESVDVIIDKGNERALPTPFISI